MHALFPEFHFLIIPHRFWFSRAQLMMRFCWTFNIFLSPCKGLVTTPAWPHIINSVAYRNPGWHKPLSLKSGREFCYESCIFTLLKRQYLLQRGEGEEPFRRRVSKVCILPHYDYTGYENAKAMNNSLDSKPRDAGWYSCRVLQDPVEFLFFRTGKSHICILNTLFWFYPHLPKSSL